MTASSTPERLNPHGPPASFAPLGPLAILAPPPPPSPRSPCLATAEVVWRHGAVAWDEKTP